jgi:hypothetical protein
MDEGFMFGSFLSIWDVDVNERVKIGIRMCIDSSIVPIYGPCSVENCIVVLIEFVNDDYE